MEIISDYRMRLRCSLRDPTGNLFHVELSSPNGVECEHSLRCIRLIGQKGKPWRRIISQLDLAFGKIDGTQIKPTRCPCFESSNFKTQGPQVFTENRSRIRHS